MHGEASLTFLCGGGEMGARLRDLEAAGMPLGEPATWSRSLRAAVALMLSSRQPVFIGWGDELVSLYNDACIPMLGDKHPQALGRPMREVWGEAWEQLAPLTATTLAGEAQWFDDMPLVLPGRGERALGYFSFSYTPIRDDDEHVRGLFCSAMETTERIWAERHARFRIELTDRLRDEIRPSRIMAITAQTLGQHLQVGRCGFAHRDGEDALIAQDWTDGRLPALSGRRPLADFAQADTHQWNAGQVLRSAEPVGAQADAPIHASLAAPLCEHGQCVAILYLQHGQAREWTRAEEDLLADVAERIWAKLEQARAKQAVRESEARFGEVANAAPVMIWISDQSKACIWFNRPWLEFTGRTMAQELGDGWADNVHPADRERCQRCYVEAFDRREPFRMDYRMRRHDGAWRHIDDKGVPRYDADGGFIGYIGSCTDITDAREAQAALRALNESLEAQVAARTAERDRVWQHSRDLLVVIGVDGIFRAVSPAWTRILGHGTQEVVGHHLREFAWPEDALLSTQAIADTVEGQDLTGFECRFCHRDGSARWISWHTSSQGELIFAYGRDITSEKAKDEALARAEEALRQAQKMEAVGQLTGGIAHDFNNLLQGVSGSLDLIRDMPQDVDNVRRWAESGLRAAERGAKLTSQLLAFSRSQKLKLKPLAIAALLRGMRDLLERTLGPAIRIELDLADTSLGALGDEVQMELAILNLAINARDAMPEGGSLTIAARAAQAPTDSGLPPGDYVELSVSDTGAGMSVEVSKRAFDPFFTTKGVGKGTGLGLSQVYGMVHQGGGTVRLASKPGQGTRVSLFLRRTSLPSPKTEQASLPSLDIAPGDRLSVLVIDDDRDVRRFLVDSLDTLGYRPREAADGRSGLAELANERPDVLIVDYAMPDMTGDEVARQARARYPGLPILFATGFADIDAIEKAVGSDAMILRKPFGLGELRALLSRQAARMRH